MVKKIVPRLSELSPWLGAVSPQYYVTFRPSFLSSVHVTSRNIQPRAPTATRSCARATVKARSCRKRTGTIRHGDARNAEKKRERKKSFPYLKRYMEVGKIIKVALSINKIQVFKNMSPRLRELAKGSPGCVTTHPRAYLFLPLLFRDRLKSWYVVW